MTLLKPAGPALSHFPRKDNAAFQKRVASSGLGAEEIALFQESWGLLLYSIGAHDPGAFRLRTAARLNPDTLRYFIVDHCGGLSREQRSQKIHLLWRCAMRMAPKRNFGFLREVIADAPEPARKPKASA